MMTVAMLELADGSVALIDADDVPRVAGYEWSLPGLGRRRGQYPVGEQRACDSACATVFLHRLIAQAGPDDIVLHRNHDTLDNRRANLIVMARQSPHAGLPLGQATAAEHFATAEAQ